MSNQKVKEIIVLTASYYRQTIDRAVLDMYADDLADLSTEAVLGAYTAYRKNPKNKTFPLPAQIREMIAPQQTPEAEAREVIDRIKIAIRDFGWADAMGARAYLGPLAWSVVKGMGGWQSVCEGDFLFNPGLIAQARNRAEDLAKFGNYDKTPFVLPAPEPIQSITHEERTFALPEPAKVLNFEIPPEEDRKKMIDQMMADFRKNNALEPA